MRQQLAAEQTRRAIVEAAARLFAEHGYRATPVARIAAEAGVAVQTIYNAVGSKRDVLARVLEASERTPPPLEGEVIAALVEHARADPLWRLQHERRVQDYAAPARALAERGALRTGLSIDAAAAAIIAVTHPAVRQALRWDDERWAVWARRTLEAALLQPRSDE